MEELHRIQLSRLEQRIETDFNILNTLSYDLKINFRLSDQNIKTLLNFFIKTTKIKILANLKGILAKKLLINTVRGASYFFD